MGLQQIEPIVFPPERRKLERDTGHGEVGVILSERMSGLHKTRQWSLG